MKILTLNFIGPYGGDIDTLALSVTFVSSSIVRVHITDANNSRWEVPDVIVSSLKGFFIFCFCFFFYLSYKIFYYLI
jgi:hypothetical protein